eukprot:scaffold799_cov220-Pinguiococcus_pyrenoidosus.AAC.1
MARLVQALEDLEFAMDDVKRFVDPDDTELTGYLFSVREDAYRHLSCRKDYAFARSGQDAYLEDRFLSHAEATEDLLEVMNALVASRQHLEPQEWADWQLYFEQDARDLCKAIIEGLNGIRIPMEKKVYFDREARPRSGGWTIRDEARRLHAEQTAQFAEDPPEGALPDDFTRDEDGSVAESMWETLLRFDWKRDGLYKIPRTMALVPREDVHNWRQAHHNPERRPVNSLERLYARLRQVHGTLKPPRRRKYYLFEVCPVTLRAENTNLGRGTVVWMPLCMDGDVDKFAREHPCMTASLAITLVGEPYDVFSGKPMPRKLYDALTFGSPTKDILRHPEKYEDATKVVNEGVEHLPFDPSKLETLPARSGALRSSSDSGRRATQAQIVPTKLRHVAYWRGRDYGMLKQCISSHAWSRALAGVDTGLERRDKRRIYAFLSDDGYKYYGALGLKCMSKNVHIVVPPAAAAVEEAAQAEGKRASGAEVDDAKGLEEEGLEEEEEGEEEGVDEKEEGVDEKEEGVDEKEEGELEHADETMAMAVARDIPREATFSSDDDVSDEGDLEAAEAKDSPVKPPSGTVVKALSLLQTTGMLSLKDMAVRREELLKELRERRLPRKILLCMVYTIISLDEQIVKEDGVGDIVAVQIEERNAAYKKSIESIQRLQDTPDQAKIQQEFDLVYKQLVHLTETKVGMVGADHEDAQKDSKIGIAGEAVPRNKTAATGTDTKVGLAPDEGSARMQPEVPFQQQPSKHLSQQPMQQPSHIQKPTDADAKVVVKPNAAAAAAAGAAAASGAALQPDFLKTVDPQLCNFIDMLLMLKGPDRPQALTPTPLSNQSFCPPPRATNSAQRKRECDAKYKHPDGTCLALIIGVFCVMRDSKLSRDSVEYEARLRELLRDVETNEVRLQNIIARGSYEVRNAKDKWQKTPLGNLVYKMPLGEAARRVHFNGIEPITLSVSGLVSSRRCSTEKGGGWPTTDRTKSFGAPLFRDLLAFSAHNDVPVVLLHFERSTPGPFYPRIDVMSRGWFEFSVPVEKLLKVFPRAGRPDNALWVLLTSEMNNPLLLHARPAFRWPLETWCDPSKPPVYVGRHDNEQEFLADIQKNSGFSVQPQAGLQRSILFYLAQTKNIKQRRRDQKIQPDLKRIRISDDASTPASPGGRDGTIEVMWLAQAFDLPAKWLPTSIRAYLRARCRRLRSALEKSNYTSAMVTHRFARNEGWKLQLQLKLQRQLQPSRVADLDMDVAAVSGLLGGDRDNEEGQQAREEFGMVVEAAEDALQPPAPRLLETYDFSTMEEVDEAKMVGDRMGNWETASPLAVAAGGMDELVVVQDYNNSVDTLDWVVDKSFLEKVRRDEAENERLQAEQDAAEDRIVTAHPKMVLVGQAQPGIQVPSPRPAETPPGSPPANDDDASTTTSPPEDRGSPKEPKCTKPIAWIEQKRFYPFDPDPRPYPGCYSSTDFEELL